MRCGQDSDCNPSSAAGILFTSMGYSNVPSRFKSALNEATYFSYTDYNFPLLMSVCESLARQVVVQAGGSIEDDPCNPGEDIFVVPVSSPVPSALLQSWDPGPPLSPSDLNGDYVVDYFDLEALTRDWLMSGYDVNAVEPNEPVGRWSFDTDGGSGSNAKNSGSLGGGWNGTLVNMKNPDWVSPGAGHPDACDPNYALDFDGINDYVDIPDFNSVGGGFTTDTLTITAWIKRNGNQDDFAGIMYSTRHGAGWDDSVCIAGLSVGADADWANWTQNKLLYHWDGDVGWWLGQKLDFTVPDDVWTFCAVSVEPTQATLYMMPDGAPMISEILYETHIETTFDQRWTIGMDERDFDGDRNFKGLIDDVRIYDYALSAEQICYVAEGAGGSYYQPVSTLADIDDSDNVDFKDYAIMAANWLEGG
ncbi:MAG: LamG domain-containing protein [Planctomycetota bacterium]